MASHRRTLAAAVATILASCSLYPLFSGIAWFWGGIGAVIVVAGVGTLTRRRRLPVIACLGAGAAGLLLYLNLVFSHANSFLHLLPTGTSLGSLWDLASQGFSQSAKYAPPAPELTGMLLLAVGGIGITAVLTDLIAVRLESAALAGLPLLLLFTEPFTLSVSRDIVGTTVSFCVGTIGYLGMLSSEGRDRIREWEHPNPDPRETPDTRELAAAGRRVGTASVVLALCLPVVIPGLHVTRLFGTGQPGIGGHGGGSGQVGFPTPDVTLSDQLHTSQSATVFRYTSTSGSPDYFQIYVLDNLSDSGWALFGQPESVLPADPQLPNPPGLTNPNYAWATKVTTHVTMDRSVSNDDLGALPVGYPATSISVNALGSVQAERSTLMVLDDNVRLGGLRYSVTSLQVSPSEQALDAAPQPPVAISSAYMQVPSSYAPLDNLANSIVNAAGAKTAFQKAVAIQRWLGQEGRFTYTLNAPTIKDANGLENFLQTTKKGYCQQFSFAMAVLARQVGIPSRIVYGFTGGTQAASNQWVVTTHDAHAWPELYFGGFGWLRFEPTPAGGAPGQGTATAPVYTQSQPGGLTKGTPPPNGGATPPPSGGTGKNARSTLGNRLGPEFHQGGAGGALNTPQGVNPWEVLGFSLLGLLVIAVGLPPAIRLLIRRWRWRSHPDAAQAHAAWRELRDDLVDYRVGYLPSESPRTVATRATATLELAEPAAASLRRIAMAEERARYAVRADSGAGLRRDSRVVRRAVAAAVPRRTRWRARLIPSSVLSPVLAAIGQASDIFSRLNVEWPRRTRAPRASRASRAGTL